MALIPYPIYILTVGNDEYILENDDMLEKIRFEFDLLVSDVESNLPRPTTEEIRLANHAQIKDLKEQTAKGMEKFLARKAMREHPDAKKFEFALRRPTTGSYTETEGKCKDIVDGKVVVDQTRFIPNLIADHVTLDGKDLSLDDAKQLSMQVGIKLFNKVKSLSFPDDRVIDFLKLQLQPSSTEQTS